MSLSRPGIGEEGGVHHADGVAVGRGLGDRAGADDAGAAGAVVDHERLAELALDLLRHQPREHVGAAARRIGHDQLDRPLRIALREGRRGARAHAAAGDECASVQCSHAFLPRCVSQTLNFRDHVLFRIGAEAGPVGHLDRAVHVRHGLGVGDAGDVGEQPLERHVALLAGDAMQRREIARAEEERVRHAGDAGLLGFGRDPEQLRDAADLDDLGCTKSVAPAAIILRKSLGLVAFSPIASGTPVALRSFASDSKSSGGQIGSSTQNGLDAFMAATGCSASPGSPAAVGVDLDRDVGAGDLARRRDRLGGALVQLDVLVAALERARGVALHVLDVAGVLQQRSVGLDALALRRRRAASTPRRLRACRGCPTARCRGR